MTSKISRYSNIYPPFVRLSRGVCSLIKRKVWLTWLAGFLATGFLVPTASSVYANQLSTVQSKEKTLKTQAQSTKQRIAALAKQQSTVKTKIVGLQGQINALTAHIATTQSQLHNRETQIAALNVQIEKTQKQIAGQYQVLEQRVRTMYEDGTGSYLNVLFSATSFSDLLDRLQLLSMIAAQDKKILHGIQSNQKALQASNAKLASAQAQEEHMKQTMVSQKSQQEQAQTLQKSLLNKLSDEKTKEQLQFKSEQDAINSLSSEIKKLIAEQGAYHTKSGWTWPVPASHTISSSYGPRILNGVKGFHDGIDVAASVGTPIVSATAGRVLLAGPASGFGDWVVIESAGGFLEIYGHMYSYEIKVSPGQDVKEGQQIAAVGDNGFSTGPHLHFTVATGFNSAGYAISVNPLKYVHP